ncbi:hypothetical protein [Riemerella columbina]|uniref:hypothetical protein n=1 Tax=Riemerella columbina TaxID=103810 RepID=UPI000360A587|nr:hypothetical protein [Riemerella columbina]
MNEYHKKRSLEAPKAVKEMQKKPLSREEVFEQQRRIQEAINKSNIERIERYRRGEIPNS